MCGIAGIWNRDGRPVDERELRRFTHTLAHRGPDGEGVHCDGEVGLGHRRLALLDLSSLGAQPMSYANGELWITFNGEIYNYVELRRELENLGHRFRGRSDTEVLLAAFAQWGPECQRRLNGMWAFAIWNSRTRSLFLSRDRFGVKPLFYVEEPGRFAFASELKAFLGLRGFPVRFNAQALANEISNVGGRDTVEQSMLEGVRNLPAGHSLFLRPGRPAEIVRWWRTLEQLEPAPKSFADQVEKFRSLFFEACRIRTRSDTALGTTLSGGLDSSSVLCTLAQLAAPRVAPQFALHTRFAGGPVDESEFAQASASRAGVDLRVKNIEAAEYLASLDAMFFDYEGTGLSAARWLTYRELRSAGVFVTLDGDGADELFAGYRNHLWSAFPATLFPLPRPAQFLNLYRAYEQMDYAGSGDPVPSRRRIAAQCYRQIGKRHLGAFYSAVVPRRFRPGTARPQESGVARSWLAIKPQSPLPLPDEDLRALCGRSPLDVQLYDDFHHMVLPQILRSVDRASMAHGVEVRSPFLDWRLVRYAFSLPSGAKLGSGFTKRILRAAMTGILPPAVEKRGTKIPFRAPLGNWLRGPLGNYLSDTLGSEAFLRCDLWEGPRIRREVETALAAGDSRPARSAWPFVQALRTTQLFQQRSSELS